MRQLKWIVWSAASVGAIAVFTALLAADGRAAEEGTLAQRNACKPDVFRLCSSFIPDRDAITACLQRNTSKLNPECRAVFQVKK